MIEHNGQTYREYRCNGIKKDGSACRALLAEENILAGHLRIKCYQCNHMNEISFKSAKGVLAAQMGEIQQIFISSKEGTEHGGCIED
jgi:phage FluMu protein Com